MNLANQVVLVTGASRGIGRAIATELGKQGATVVGTATSESGAQAITDYLAAEGVTGKGLVLNVTDAARCAAVVDGGGDVGCRRRWRQRGQQQGRQHG